MHISWNPPSISPLPPGIITLDDHERHAGHMLGAAAHAYFAGTAADGLTHAANRQGWRSLTLRPRVLQSLTGGHTRTLLQGATLHAPLLLAPVAHQQLAHPDGELASACAAAAMGVGMVVSTLSSIPIEPLAACLHDSGGLPPWFQLYAQPHRDDTLALIRRAEQAGCAALVLTVDAPVQGVRDAERRAGFVLPPQKQPPHLADLPNRPWPASHAEAGLCQGVTAHAPTWADVEWLQKQTSLPLWLKGVTHPQDARRAQDLGIHGLIVSNHGGRTLDTMPSTSRLLPQVRAAVGADFPLLVDGGIRRGTDVFKALALGANAVLIGRPQVFALANAGARGVAHMLRTLRDELEACMALCGCATVDAIGPEHLE